MKHRIQTQLRTLLILTASCLLFPTHILAQEPDFRPQSWRFGISGAFQHNTAALGWQQLHGSDPNFHSADNSIDYVDGTGSGSYAGIFAEYLSTSWWGLQLRAAIEQRNALIIDDTRLPIPSFDTKVSYLVIEPMFRVDQNLIPRLSLVAGPVLAFNMNSTYQYNANPNGVGTEIPNLTESSRDIPNFNKTTYGFQGGLGYDITIAQLSTQESLVLTPFFEGSWIVAQKQTINEPTQNSVYDIWSTITYRAGIRLAFDNASVADPVTNVQPTEPNRTPLVTKNVVVVLPPQKLIVTKNVQGYYPIHPYVFFDKGSTTIPTRYNALSLADATNFKETDLGDFMKGDLTTKETNVNQLMSTYLNVMNVYADRMRRNPSEQLTLRGCDPEQKEGLAYALKVRDYLVNTFGIDRNRITIVVEDPMKPSGTYFTDPAYASLIDDENRRVVFVLSNPEMLKSLSYTIRDESSIDNDMIFSVSNAKPFKSWDITITGENRSMYFGPYVYSTERVNPAELMRFLDNGSYNAKVQITELDGQITEENIAFNLQKDRQVRNASRYLMLFDYDKADAIERYENRIRSEITPDMKEGNTVIVHGHTDVIGNPAANQALSQQRAEQAKSIIDAELKVENKAIPVTAIGVGQEKMQYTFDNRLPEGRMYNRNVFIEVIE